ADAGFACIATALEQGSRYGYGNEKKEPRYLVEYVSANPTGPLHVGHGRHAAYGASVSRILKAAGFPVAQEYYVNDAGRQMEILAISVLIRALQLRSGDSALPMPAAGYQGEYIKDIAKGIVDDYEDVSASDLQGELGDEMPEGSGGDDALSPDAYIDGLIENAQCKLGDDRFNKLRRHALNEVLDDIRDDMAEFGVHPDVWFSEESLSLDGTIDNALERVREHGLLYEKGGATWFKATELGDEKDRVVVRDNGKKTYFASDIAYHFNKRERGFDRLLDILGSDHHGYIARVRAGMQAMGYDPESLDVSLVQFVTLYRNKRKVQMSTRSGKFVTLRELRNEVGNDAARFFYVMRSNDQHLDFDLDLARSQSNENPVYYVQYAHARIASVFRQLAEKNFDYDQAEGLSHLAALTEMQEKALASDIARYPEIIQRAADKRAPHVLVNYLRELATQFHSLYNANEGQYRFIVDDAALRNARLALISAAKITLASGLDLLGVSAPERM
ncbi:MAG: arginine--tRNA ligase, partial [Pseudomonadota bacterium]